MYGHQRLGYLVDERYLRAFLFWAPMPARDFTSSHFGPSAGVRSAFGRDAGRRGRSRRFQTSRRGGGRRG